MNSIDFLEFGGADSEHPFSIRWMDYIWPLEDPREQHYQWVLTALYVQHLPSIPQELATWQHDLVFEHWRAAWELPEFAEARRLAYLVDNYRGAISSDLHTFANGTDLGDLWRARRWTTLIDIIDRLPAHSWYAATAANDEQHAKMIAQSVAERRGGKAAEDKGPAMTTWTPEVAVLTNVLDAVRNVQHAVYAAQHGKKAGEPPKPAQRPITALERAMRRADFESRKAAHESLVARVLPHKAAVKG